MVFIFFIFLSCISFFFLYFNCFYHKKKKNDANILGCTLCELRTMLVSVVGVGIHWLNPIMRLITCSVYGKFFQNVALLGIVLEL